MVNTDTTAQAPMPSRARSGSPLPIGTRLADFEITGIVGEGGFGTVYLAFEPSLQRTVAIKEYMPSTLSARGADNSVIVFSHRHQETFDAGLKSFINEARLLAQFDHPAVVKVYRYWEENRTGYMAMRYYEGRTLKNVLQHEPESVTEAWLKSILDPVLQALDALNRMQILHRDISPDNIMIEPSGNVVLLDFGAARQIIGDMTQALTVILKPGYAPIEQYADEASMKQGPWTDIYALSAVVYFVINGKPPPAAVARMIKDPLQPLASGDYADFSREFLAAIDKGLAVKPEDRPQTIEEFRALLGLDGKQRSARATFNHAEQGVKTPAAAAMAEAPAHYGAPAVASSDRGLLALLHAQGSKLMQHVQKLACKAPKPSLPVIGGVALLVAALVSYLVWDPASVPTTTPSELASQVAVAGPATGLSDGTAAFDLTDEQPLDVEAAISVDPAEEWAALMASDNDVTLQINEFLQRHPAFLSSYPLGKSADSARSNMTMVTGMMRLGVKPWGEVLVDGQSQGVSPPMKRLLLPEGRHQITIRNSSFPDHVVEVEVSKDNPVSIDYDFTASP